MICKSLTETKPKPEPWNPVQITFDLPADAAKRLSQLAEGDDEALLRELGIISFQIQGEKVGLRSLRAAQFCRINYGELYLTGDDLV